VRRGGGDCRLVAVELRDAALRGVVWNDSDATALLCHNRNHDVEELRLEDCAGLCAPQLSSRELRYAEIARCPQLSDEAVASLFGDEDGAAPLLRAVSIRDCPAVCQPLLLSRSLRCLSLVDCIGLQDAAVAPLFGGGCCPALRRLNLSGCEGLVQPLCDVALSTDPCGLRHVSFARCIALSDDAATALLCGACPELESVDLSKTRLASPFGSASEVSASLRHAKFDRCDNLTTVAVNAVLGGCPSLRTFSAEGFR